MDLFKTQAAPQTGLYAPETTATSAVSSIGRKVMMAVGVVLLFVVVYYIFKYFARSRGSSTKTAATSDDLTPTAVDGKAGTKITEDKLPTADGSDYGIQFWLYIKDWNHRFGQTKNILTRGANGLVISLHPTDNSLNVKVPIYSGGGAKSTSSTGDSYTCTVENVPLQSWFATSVTVFQRNLDIYINGQLVKSCVLPGVPKIVAGDVQVGGSSGFSGAFCNMKFTPRGLVPGDASEFYGAGTSCNKPAGGAAVPEGKGFTLFGYKFSFSVFKEGKSVYSGSVGQ